VSGWLPTLVALAVITWFRSWRAMLALIVAGLVVVLLAGTFLEQDYDREYDESGSTRMAKWTLVASQPFVRNHFLLGTGPANYALYFSAYTPQDRLSTHNNYADIYLQMGLVGIGVLFWVVVGTGRLALAIRKAGPSDPFVDAFVHSVIGGVAAVLVAMMLGDWFTPFVYNQTLAGFSWTVQSWIFMGALCAVPTILRDESDAAAGFPALAGHLS
jgi:O-antigen ligase